MLLFIYDERPELLKKTAHYFKIDYLENYNTKNFKKIKRQSRKFNLFIAYYIKNVRLIDNI